MLDTEHQNLATAVIRRSYGKVISMNAKTGQKI